MSVNNAIMVPHPPVIIPEIGNGEENKLKSTRQAYFEAARFIIKSKPKTIIMISPHTTLYLDYFHISPGTKAIGNFSAFGGKDIAFKIPYDAEFASILSDMAKDCNISAGMLGEKNKKIDHGCTVPLWFLNRCGEEIDDDLKFVRIGISGLSLAEHYRLGVLIEKAAKTLNRDVSIIASGDLSHRLAVDSEYGYAKEGAMYDKKIMEVMGKAEFDKLLNFSDVFCDKAGECGHRSFTMMAGCFDGYDVKANKLSYEAPFGIGYGICTFQRENKDYKCEFFKKYEDNLRIELDTIKQNEDEYVKLARKAAETYILYRKIINIPDDASENLKNDIAGVFVSLKKDGILRGCVGTIFPSTACIAQEIVRNAVSAVSDDPRFNPVQQKEMKDLIYSVDVLGQIEKITSKSELDIKKYGLIVTRGMKQGLLLPGIDGIDSVDEQIEIARKKAGIGQGEEVIMQRFEAVRHI